MGLRTVSNARVGVLVLAAAAGLSPLPAGWVALARANASAHAPVYQVETRSLEPDPKVSAGPHLPKDCVLLLKRGKPGLWSVLVERGSFGVRDLKAVKCLKPGTPAWMLRGRGLPLDIAWPALAVARRELDLEATGYDPGPDDNTRGWVGATRTGSRARFGIVAVDPALIPLGTRVYVEGYGPALAADVGGAIKGRRIDLCFNTSSEARDWGRRRRRVWIVDPAPRPDRPGLRAALSAGL